jgi:hypothetical protein
MGQPVIKDSSGPLRHMTAADKLSLPVDEDVLAKGGAHRWLARNAAGKFGVKARAYAVVLVQKMHPLSARKGDTAVPVAGNPAMTIARMKLHPGKPSFRQKPGAVEIARTIIDEGDLHVFGGDAGSKHAVDGLTQQMRIGIPAGNHHRPERPGARRCASVAILPHARRRYSE